MNPEIQSITDRIPALKGVKELIVEKIDGLTNANYQITAGKNQYVLRISRENAEKLGINRDFEYEALQVASSVGIGPEVIYFSKPEGHLVTRWIDGRHWTHDEYRRPENIRLLTQTVKQLHSLPAIEGRFSPFNRVEAYTRTAKEYDIPLPYDFEALLDTMREIEEDQRKDQSDWLRFCHNDLVAVNYLYSDEQHKITIIDWEFAGMGDIYYDLATLVYTHDSIGPIPPELEEFMLQCYFTEVSNDSWIRLSGMKFMLMLFTAMWGLSQYGMQKAGFIEEVEGFDYLEFAQYLFSHDVESCRAAYLKLKEKQLIPK
ncbi:MAG: phosphotransferase [Candidatus Thorarchaeota archaeon]